MKIFYFLTTGFVFISLTLLTNCYMDYQESYQNLTTETQTLDEKIQILKDEVNKIKDDIEDLFDDAQDLEHSCGRDIRSKERRFDRNIDDIKDDISDVSSDSDISEIEDVIKDLKEDLDDLEDDYDDCENEPRRRTSFGGSGGSSDDDDPINPDDDDPPNTPVARARRIPADFDYDRSFKQSVAFYGLIGGCDGPSTQPEREAFKRCTKACTTTACLNGCADNSTANCGFLFGDNNRTSATINNTFCSGVFLKNNQVLTNHHCVDYIINEETIDSDNDYVFNIYTSVERGGSGSNRFSTVQEVLWYSPSSDLDAGSCFPDDPHCDDVALVQLSNPISGAISADLGSKSDLRVLDELFTIGNPSGRKFVASLGHLTKKNPTRKECFGINCILHSIPNLGGNSGGPIFNYEGKLVGLIAFGDEYPANIEGGPHIDVIKTHIHNRPNAQQQRTVNRNLVRESRLMNKEVFGRSRLSKRDNQELARRIKEMVLELQENGY